MSFLFPVSQLLSEEVSLAIKELSQADNSDQRGAVYTKLEVVEAILDLVGYVESADLMSKRLLEPSFGNGDFLIPVLDRLFASLKRQGQAPESQIERLKACLVAVELHSATFLQTREKLMAHLQSLGVSSDRACELCQAWLKNDDFLTVDLAGSFDTVVGNPPYVRQERIPTALLKFYKQRYKTLYDRADLYILFFERCLDLLSHSGQLGFICANRWLKNKYGGPLRTKVSDNFRLKYFIDLSVLGAFHSEVIAYPAITVIEKNLGKETIVSNHRVRSLPELNDLVLEMKAKSFRESSNVSLVCDVTKGRDPWLLDSPAVLKVLRQLERNFPVLEHANVRVGIGVASGCDKVLSATIRLCLLKKRESYLWPWPVT